MKKFLFIIGVLTANCTYSQVYTATAKLDTNSIPLGGQTVLQLKVFVPSDLLNDQGKFIQWPLLKDSISSNIEIVESSGIDTSFSKDNKTAFLIQNLNITSFDTGFFVIPPLRFLKSGDSARFFETQPILLKVIPVSVDTSQAIKDIKPPFQAPYTLKEAAPYIIAVVLLLAILLLIYRYWQKIKNKSEIIIHKVPELLPHVVALEKLEELKEKKLWQEGKTKLYHTLITEIIRVYLESRFKIKALEQTSDEIIISCRSLPINQEAKFKLEQMLVLADLVKFAKSQPISGENELSYTHAIEFVKSTVPQEITPKNKEEEDANV
ncbi:MAG: hypothetical protein M3Q58_00775 [Bacteroidota bacterium]|nr:hypothetical protein [Bacteroidota bacterium]